jgi:hypothetical protein
MGKWWESGKANCNAMHFGPRGAPTCGRGGDPGEAKKLQSANLRRFFPFPPVVGTWLSKNFAMLHSCTKTAACCLATR